MTTKICDNGDMKLVTTEDGSVTPIAIVMAIRDCSYGDVATKMGVSKADLFAWAEGRRVPTTAQIKRLSLIIRWPWVELYEPPWPHDEAYSLACEARRNNALAN